jgi:hypothetical protein
MSVYIILQTPNARFEYSLVDPEGSNARFFQIDQTGIISQRTTYSIIGNNPVSFTVSQSLHIIIIGPGVSKEWQSHVPRLSELCQLCS